MPSICARYQISQWTWAIKSFTNRNQSEKQHHCTIPRAELWTHHLAGHSSFHWHFLLMLLMHPTCTNTYSSLNHANWKPISKFHAEQAFFVQMTFSGSHRSYMLSGINYIYMHKLPHSAFKAGIVIVTQNLQKHILNPTFSTPVLSVFATIRKISFLMPFPQIQKCCNLRIDDTNRSYLHLSSTPID